MAQPRSERGSGAFITPATNLVMREVSSQSPSLSTRRPTVIASRSAVARSRAIGSTRDAEVRIGPQWQNQLSPRGRALSKDTGGPPLGRKVRSDNGASKQRAKQRATQRRYARCDPRTLVYTVRTADRSFLTSSLKVHDFNFTCLVEAV